MSVDRDKRKFLKILGIGSVGFLLANIIEKSWGQGSILGERQFNDFKLVETGKNLKLFTSAGEEIITFEKE